jgi:hypothetical protein
MQGIHAGQFRRIRALSARLADPWPARVGCEGDETEIQFQDFTLGEIHQRLLPSNES